MVKREGEDLIRREPSSILINNAKAVRIAVQPQAQLCVAGTDEPTDFGHPFCIGFRMVSAKQWIGLAVKNRDPGARVGQQRAVL